VLQIYLKYIVTIFFVAIYTSSMPVISREALDIGYTLQASFPYLLPEAFFYLSAQLVPITCTLGMEGIGNLDVSMLVLLVTCTSLKFARVYDPT
jgi:hypothetical protein